LAAKSADADWRQAERHRHVCSEPAQAGFAAARHPAATVRLPLSGSPLPRTGEGLGVGAYQRPQVDAFVGQLRRIRSHADEFLQRRQFAHAVDAQRRAYPSLRQIERRE